MSLNIKTNLLSACYAQFSPYIIISHNVKLVFLDIKSHLYNHLQFKI